jgi:hypothetical protein
MEVARVTVHQFKQLSEQGQIRDAATVGVHGLLRLKELT